MEHIIVTDLSNGYYLLKPEDGYELYSEMLDRVVPEAIVSKQGKTEFSSRAIEGYTKPGKKKSK